MCSILLKTCLNRGNHDLKFDLCVRMLGKQQKKIASYSNSERNEHFKFMFSFSQISHLKTLITLTVIINLNKSHNAIQ